MGGARQSEPDLRLRLGHLMTPGLRSTLSGFASPFSTPQWHRIRHVEHCPCRSMCSRSSRSISSMGHSKKVPMHPVGSGRVTTASVGSQNRSYSLLSNRGVASTCLSRLMPISFSLVGGMDRLGAHRPLESDVADECPRHPTQGHLGPRLHRTHPHRCQRSEPQAPRCRRGRDPHSTALSVWSLRVEDVVVASGPLVQGSIDANANIAHLLPWNTSTVSIKITAVFAWSSNGSGASVQLEVSDLEMRRVPPRR